MDWKGRWGIRLGEYWKLKSSLSVGAFSRKPLYVVRFIVVGKVINIKSDHQTRVALTNITNNYHDGKILMF